MGKMNKAKLRIIIFISLIIFCIGALGFLLSQGFTIGAGGTTLSLQQVEIQSSNPNLGMAKTWLATVAVNGLGEQIIGETWGANEVPTGTDEKATKPLTITYNLDKESCSYIAEDTGKRFTKWEMVAVPSLTFEYVPFLTRTVSGSECHWTGVLGYESYETACTEKGGIIFTCAAGDANRQCYRPVQTLDAGLLNFQTPETAWQVTFKVNNGDRTESITINNKNALIGSRPNNIFITTAGDLSASRACPVPTGSSLYVKGTTKKLIAYRTHTSILTEEGINGYCRMSHLDSCERIINEHNSKVNIAIGASPSSEFTGSRGTVSYVADGISIDTSKNPQQYPLIQLLVKADWLGIMIPATNPQILSVVPTTIVVQSGRQSTVSVQTRNDGEAGSIITSISCPSGVSISGSPQSRAYSQGQTATTSFYLGGTAGTYTCKAIATDAKDSTIRSEMTFGVEVSRICDIDCTPIPPKKIIFHADGTCSCVCDRNALVCSTGYMPDYITCKCVKTDLDECPTRPERIDNSYWIDFPTCAWACDEDYYMDAGGECVKDEGEDTTPPDCDELCDLEYDCDALDFSCAMNNSMCHFNCTLAKLTETLMLTIGLVIVLITGLAVLVFVAKRKGKRRKRRR